MMQY